MIHYLIRKRKRDTRFNDKKFFIVVHTSYKPFCEWSKNWKEKLVNRYGHGEFSIILVGAGPIQSIFRGFL